LPTTFARSGIGYHRQTWELIRKVVADVCDAASAKVP
jgi:hypothetical protein